MVLLYQRTDRCASFFVSPAVFVDVALLLVVVVVVLEGGGCCCIKCRLFSVLFLKSVFVTEQKSLSLLVSDVIVSSSRNPPLQGRSRLTSSFSCRCHVVSGMSAVRLT